MFVRIVGGNYRMAVASQPCSGMRGKRIPIEFSAVLRKSGFKPILPGDVAFGPLVQEPLTGIEPEMRSRLVIIRTVATDLHMSQKRKSSE